ncbi:PG0541 family transporter-associated protein [Treponema pectinovorum]|uniref:PG0541 family transporter-associated protein n=1 Tax=Treponema pectinovorum TaxID=164 RepID=UPI0011C7BC62|nr:PG0541 family transporter-associated protein [Treponema pectinovorum]
MTRCEVIANQSVQEEIVLLLEEHLPHALYTIIPTVMGRGKKTSKLGNSIWPETNFILLTYVEDNDVSAVKAIIAAVKEKFKGEGIKLFCIKAEDATEL